LDIWTSCITIWHQIMVKVMFTSLPVPFFREFIFKTNLMRNQEKPFRIWNKLSLVRAQAQLHKKMLTLNVTNRIIMKITVWLIPTRQRFDNCLLKKFNYILKIDISGSSLSRTCFEGSRCYEVCASELLETRDKADRATCRVIVNDELE
jgi:hypothetical protein